jgi:hypothetical protein
LATSRLSLENDNPCLVLNIGSPRPLARCLVRLWAGARGGRKAACLRPCGTQGPVPRGAVADGPCGPARPGLEARPPRAYACPCGWTAPGLCEGGESRPYKLRGSHAAQEVQLRRSSLLPRDDGERCAHCFG